MIEKLGRYLSVDADGYLVPDVSKDHIPPHWFALIQTIIKFIEQNGGDNIRAIYLRGSVPRGFALDGISDLDLIFIVRDASLKLDRKDFEQELLQRFHFCADIEWMVSLESRFEKLPQGQPYPHIVKMLKTQGLHLWGHDYVADLPRVKPGREMINHALHLEAEWHEFLEIITTSQMSQKALDAECRWMGKRILRTAFELAALERKVFTRDLMLCQETAAQVFPQIGEALQRVLDLTIEAKASAEKIQEVFSPVMAFIIPRCRQLAG